MTLDIRAIVYCNLGKVVSGNFSDDYLQGSGIIKTSGSVVLDGIYAPTVGQKVEFAYYKDGIVSRLPRTLRVLSFFADPFRRTTTVEIGCAFTYYSNRKPPAKNPTSAEENPELPCVNFQKTIVPISASYVFQTCLSALSLSATSNPLTSKFSVEEFDLSSGYVQVIGDLLLSEGYFCYLDEREKVVVRNFNSSSSLGPLITGEDIIEIGPIGVGDLPGDGAIVRYNSLRLKEPDPTETEEEAEVNTQIRDWELDQSSQTGGYTYITAWKVIGIVEGFSNGSYIQGWTQEDYQFPDYTITETRSEYDRWNRVTKRTTTTKRPIASVNPSYIAAQINNVVFSPKFDRFGVEFDPLPSGADECEEIQIEYSYYASNPPEPSEEEEESCVEPPPPAADDGFDSLIRKETYKYDSYAKVIASVWQGNYYEPIFVKDGIYEYLDWQIISLTTNGDILVEKVVELYDKQETSVTVTDADGQPVVAKDIITKQTTERYIHSAYKREGQRAIANQTSVSVFAYNVRTVRDALAQMGLVFDTITVNTTIGRNAFVESRPGRADRINTVTQKEEPQTETVAEIAFIGGSVGSETYVEFQIPYPPDDYIQVSGENQYTLVKSDVAAKALNFGRVQNRLLLGNRNGVSIQISADVMPPRPFDPIYIEAEGVKGQYRTNGTSYTFDTTGIIASTDAMFWGGLQ